ncbi:MAG: AAA family ATPase [Methylomicrobium sp.]
MTSATQLPPHIAKLLDPSAYPHPTTTTIELIETHISWVLLTGPYAYKIKKPVDFGFLDFSTLEKRHLYCEEELRLNRRFSTMLYLEVATVNGPPECPSIGGLGPIIDYAVKMRQFGQSDLLSYRAEKNLLTSSDIDGIASSIARFHREAAIADPQSPFGEADDIKHWSDENFEHIEPLLQNDRDRAQIRRLKDWMQSEYEQRAETLRERKRLGFVKECHGDLHLGNIASIDDTITPFDCIEFNPKLRWIDTASEIAFLFMDLTHRQREHFAWRMLNGYLQRSGDYPSLRLLRYYLVYRALVRAKVALLSRQPDNDRSQQDRLQNDYNAYADLAERYTKPPTPRLLITHGPSGSGKSFFAKQLSETIGAVQLRSDIERKRLFGFEPNAETASAMGGGIYDADAGRKTYRHLAEWAKMLLLSGFDAIVDAAFLKHEQRALFIDLAETGSIPLLMLDFQATEAALSERIEQRRAQRNDPSEATLDILRQQLKSQDPLSDAERQYTVTIDTERPDATAQLVEAVDKLGKRR